MLLSLAILVFYEEMKKMRPGLVVQTCNSSYLECKDHRTSLCSFESLSQKQKEDGLGYTSVVENWSMHQSLGSIPGTGKEGRREGKKRKK